MKKWIFGCLFFAIFMIQDIRAEAQEFFPKKDKYVIVIDPGHGGENSGTMSNENYKEKDIIMKTTKALVEELNKYEEIEVHLTRQEDVDISLTQRAMIAKELNADFLFSLHYNASENHSLFGSEVWISSKSPYHSYGYKFGYLHQLEMQDMGLFSRGIKTRVNETNTDYYGIIRECVARNIPAVIIEHCHVDEDRDILYCDEDSDFEEFGRRDAIAIAKFLGVYDGHIGNVKVLDTIKEKDIIANTSIDLTGPEECKIEVENADYESGILTIKVSAKDKQTQVMYYTYSIDGGSTYSQFYTWPGTDLLTGECPESFSLMLSIPAGYIPVVSVRAYNKNEIYKTSNRLRNFEAFATPAEPLVVTAKNTPAPDITANEPKEIVESVIEVLGLETISEDEKTVFQISLKRFVLLLFFIVLWVSLLIIMVHLVKHIIGEKKASSKFK